MAKPRVHQVAKELGITSKVAMAKLQELGEFVKTASSTIEEPVARKLRDALAAEGGGAAKEDGGTKKPAAPKPGARKPAAPKAEAKKQAPSPKAPAAPAVSKPAAAEPASKPSPSPKTKPAPRADKPTADKSAAAKPAAGKPAAAKGGPKPGGPRPAGKPGGARPGNNPFAPSQGMGRGGRDTGGQSDQRGAEQRGGGPRPGGPRPGGPRPADKPGGARPGNNPFAPSQGMGRGTRDGGPRPGGPRPGGPRPGGPRPAGAGAAGKQGGPRPAGGAPRSGERGGASGGPGGGPRPNPNMMPGRSSVVGRQNAGGPGGPGKPGGGPGRGRGGFGGPGKPGGGPGRGRGGTQGAFGRGGGRPSRGRKSKRAKRAEFEQMQAPSIGGVSVPRGNGMVVKIRRGSTLADLGERIDVDPASLVAVLLHLGEMATATQSLDEDTFALLGAELGYEIQLVSPEDEERELFAAFDIDLAGEEEAEGEDELEARPPVVTVMGHVDHGKTKLLDAVRSSNVVAGEHGGITQAIGAYQVHKEHDGRDRAITFIDTPGHEAFTAMRARGAKVTDIAILVVAADDGVMPQTVEALNHAQAAHVPIVVAINKVDKDGANPDKVMQQLTEYNLVAEEYGGDIMFVKVSALKREGLDELLEAVLLTADAALELQANPDKDARGVAIEGHLDKGRGSVATVLVQSGTLRVGDAIVAGTAHGRVRAMLDELGANVEEAGPSRPVQVLGLTSVPGAGETFVVAPDDRTARQIGEKREASDRAALLAKRRKRVSLEDLNAALAEGKVETLNLILKGDGSGSVEALEEALLKIEVGEDEVDLRIIHRGVGAITQNDVNLATVDNAIIIGFNVRPAERVAELADREGVDMRFYSVIYKAIEEVEQALRGMLKPEYEEVQLGTAEIRQVFRSSKFGNIAGSVIRSGMVRRNAAARLLRDGIVVAEDLKVESLRREKDDVTEVKEGFECGIGLGSFNDIKEGDTIETYEMREKPRD